MTRDIKAEIDQTLQAHRVVLYMKGNRHMPQCGFSAAAIAMLDELGVPYREVNVLADPEVRDGIKRYADWPTIPQLYVDGDFVGGSDIMREMHGSGELAALVRRSSGAA